jgi:ribonuclease-3
LQELCARRFDDLPRYEVTDEGPDHAKRFDALVRVLGSVRGSGHGRSKKQAEQAAARVAWQQLSAELAAREARQASEAQTDQTAQTAQTAEPAEPAETGQGDGEGITQSEAVGGA